MEDKTSAIESLIERATEFGKTSFDLAKLKVLDKTSDVVSSITSHYVVIIFISSFILFINFGLALWLGEILGKIYYGFFVVAAFYGITGILVHFILHKWLKRIFGDYFIKQVLK
jgi:hypothetical protein